MGFVWVSFLTVYIKGGHVEAYGYDDYPGISSEYMNISITGGDVYAYSPEACGIGGGQDRGTYGKVMIEGEGTVVRAKSDEYAGIDGGYHGDRTIRGSFNFGPGITLELWSPGLGDKHQHSWCHHRQAYYEGSKYTVGATKETARILPDDERQEAYLNDDYTYMLIEPCNHKDAAGTSLLDAKGRCTACAHQEYPATYDEYSWNEGQLTSFGLQLRTSAACSESCSSSWRESP